MYSWIGFSCSQQNAAPQFSAWFFLSSLQMHLFIVVTIVWEEIKKEKKKKTNAKHRLYPRHIHCCSEWLPVIYFEIVFDVFQLFVIWEETFLCWCRFEYISSAFATNPHSAQRAAAHIIISVGWLNTLEQETVHFGLVSTISTCWCLRMHRPLLLNARAYQRLNETEEKKKWQSQQRYLFGQPKNP